MRIGAHVSIAGGLDRSIDKALKIGTECIQIFTKSQVRWEAKPLIPEHVIRFRAGVRRRSLEPVAVHASYLINLASKDPSMWRKSSKALAQEMDRAREVGASFVVVHPGSHGGEGEAAGVRRVAEAVRTCLEATDPQGPLLLIENTAGQGSGLGFRFEHLRDILGLVQAQGRLGICLDTCHALSAGYRLSSRAYARLFLELDRVIGLQHVRAFHINDSKRALGARVDRHERIGKGSIGLSFFRRLVRDARFAALPGYLEIPGDTDAFRQDARVLKELRDFGSVRTGSEEQPEGPPPKKL